MTKECFKKLTAAGFQILRPDYFRMQIKVMRNYRFTWQVLEDGFETKAAIDRRIKELLAADQKTILDNYE